MNTSSNQFGLMVAYLLPGFIGLAGIAPFAPIIGVWLEPLHQEASLGPSIYAVLAATTVGMILSCFRWLLIDHIHHGWQLRTEAVGLPIDRWHTREILAHLTPRPIAWAAEQVVWDDVRDRLDNRLCEWPLMAPARPIRADGVLFREANTPEDYAALGQRLGLGRTLINCADSNQMPGYKLG